MTLIEVMAAMAILIITLLGVVSGLVLAINSNGDAGRRSQMREFARGRLERLVTSNKQIIQPIPASFAGPFNPDSAPGTGGWVLDTFEALPGGSGGNDDMAGPVIVDGEGSGLDSALTQTQRASVLAAPPPLGCGDPSLAQPLTLFCREIHVEQVIVTAGAGISVPILRVWVRALQPGGNWRFQNATLQKEFAR
jgi:type II secretory pathway pseudopilin PulG